MVGYGFMGRTHSNAFLQAATFSMCRIEPVLKTVCARNADARRHFADKWGYESVETDWRSWWNAGYRPDRYRQPQRHARGNRHRRRAGRQDGDVREAAGPQRRRSRGHGERGGSGGRAQHGLVQLPPRARGDAAQAADRRRALRPDLPLPRASSCRTGPSRRIFRRAAKGSGGWTSTWPAAA